MRVYIVEGNNAMTSGPVRIWFNFHMCYHLGDVWILNDDLSQPVSYYLLFIFTPVSICLYIS